MGLPFNQVWNLNCLLGRYPLFNNSLKIHKCPKNIISDCKYHNRTMEENAYMLTERRTEIHSQPVTGESIETHSKIELFTSTKIHVNVRSQNSLSWTPLQQTRPRIVSASTLYVIMLFWHQFRDSFLQRLRWSASSQCQVWIFTDGPVSWSLPG